MLPVLLVFRMQEAKLNQLGAQEPPNDLIQTLGGKNVKNNHDVEFIAIYDGSVVLNAQTRLRTLFLDRCHYCPKGLKKHQGHIEEVTMASHFS